MSKLAPVFFFALFFVGCESPSSTEGDVSKPVVQPVRVPDEALGRAGSVTMELPEFRQAIAEARALQEWRSGKAAPLTALENMMLRRRVLTRGLETRVVRAEARKRNLTPDIKVVNALLAQAAAGRPPNLEAARANRGETASADELEARLAKRFGPLAPYIRQAALDVIEAGLLADDLLEKSPESRIRSDWQRENTRIVLDLIRIPRVPETAEISRAVRSMQTEMKAYHAKESKFFRKPARVFVRRMALPWDGTITSEKKAESRQLADTLRKRIESGEDMIALVREFGAKQDHRSGGKMTFKKEKRPDLFDMKKGRLSPIEEVASGLVFYRIEGRAAAMNRPFSDNRVQREIAATLLRESDKLPAAQRLAQQVRTLFIQTPNASELAELVKKNRLRRATTPSFSESRRNAVPTIGLAPELFKQAFELSSASPVTQIVTVRQDYVVARLIERETVNDQDWAKQRGDYTQRWKTRRRPRMVDEFLSETLKGQALWVDMKRLEVIKIEDLGIKATNETVNP